MSASLTAADVFNAALLLEEQGVQFYTEAASGFSGEEKKLLLGLAAMERSHKEQFRKFLDILPSKDHETPSEEKSAHLQSLIGDRIITNTGKINEWDTYGVILEKAIWLEKNAVFFYTAVKDILVSEMDVTAVERLIGEELRHFETLTDALHNWQEKKGGL